MSPKPPHNPLIVIIGATGTGKSQVRHPHSQSFFVLCTLYLENSKANSSLQLAVDLALEHNGEIINGDAMQLYDGLPIITNKMTVEEQQGIPHHLLGTIGLEEEPWRVGVFKRKAIEVIKEIRSRGRLPILVGGTHYYTQALLLDETLLSEDRIDENGLEEVEDENIPREELDRRFPILTKGTVEILQKLREVDPVMADRWHPKDRRRIQRSLEIWLMTGKQASKVYEEQRERKHQEQDADKHGPRVEPQPSLLDSTLIFWVHANHEVLKSRLDTRVDKMVASGLIDEVFLLGAFLEKQTSAGVKVDRTSGIWVSIGFKEFEPYLAAKSYCYDSKEALSASIERTKVATRHYAKRQIQWIRNKLIIALFSAKVGNSLYLLDGTDLSSWKNNVSKPALDIVNHFLAGDELPTPQSMSAAASELLAPKKDYDISERTDLWIRETCELCHMTAVTKEQWETHVKSRRHRRLTKSKNNGRYKARPEQTGESSKPEEL
jgi:tRNA dimethylallyltransferase